MCLQNLPEIKKYMESDAYEKLPMNSKGAKFGNKVWTVPQVMWQSQWLIHQVILKLDDWEYDQLQNLRVA